MNSQGGARRTEAYSQFPRPSKIAFLNCVLTRRTAIKCSFCCRPEWMCSESDNGDDSWRRFNEANKLENLPFWCQTIVCTFLPRLYRQWTETSAEISFGKPQLANMLVVARAAHKTEHGNLTQQNYGNDSHFCCNLQITIYWEHLVLRIFVHYY